jgi:N-formylglutamate deformylase
MSGRTSSSEYTDLLVSTIKDDGYSVSVNTPYDGGILMSNNSDPENNVHSLMIEINKRLFMDIKTFKLTDGALPTRLMVEKIMDRVCRHVAQQVRT